MKPMLASAALASLIAVSAHVDGHTSGDADAGAKAFNKCKTCHMIASADETFVKGGKTGPNFWGLPGSTAGTQEDFKRYKKFIKTLGESGFTWSEADFVVYVADPHAFLREKLDDSKAQSGMTFRLKNSEDAAYIASVSPPPES